MENQNQTKRIMKRVLFSIAVLLAGLSAQAQSYDYLTFRAADGTERSMSIDGLRITFADGQMQAVNNSESFSTSLAGLSQMFFTETPTAIKGMAVEAAHFSFDGGLLRVNAPQGRKICIYGADGRLVSQHVKQADGMEQIPLSLLRGVYIVNVNGVTTKLTVR